MIVKEAKTAYSAKYCQAVLFSKTVCNIHCAIPLTYLNTPSYALPTLVLKYSHGKSDKFYSPHV